MTEKEQVKALLKKRATLQIFLALGFVILNIILFFVWPKIAYLPLIMIPLMIISAFFWSRGFCGWACPRAAFMERFVKPFTFNKPAPKWMHLGWVSALIFIVLISRVTYVGFTKGALAAGFLLCIVPTIGALLLGWYSPKSWCAVCPTGTILKVVDPGVFRVKKNDCTSCGVCDKACPMGISVSKLPQNSYINEPNCTQCGLCVAACPKESLEMPKNTKKTAAISTNKAAV